MQPALKDAFDQAMKQARSAYHKGHYTESFSHLERAHILGQRYILPHTRSHLWMLKVAWKTRCKKEIRGQLLRIPAALIMSRIWVPIGNTGGSNVSPLKPMPLPPELLPLLQPEHD